MPLQGGESKKIAHFLLASSEFRNIDSGTWEGTPKCVVPPHHFAVKKARLGGKGLARGHTRSKEQN